MPKVLEYGVFRGRAAAARLDRSTPLETVQGWRALPRTGAQISRPIRPQQSILEGTHGVGLSAAEN
jgi:hypothetical protein